MTIGQSIRQHRNKLGISQLDLANMVGVHPVNISWWENDHVFPSILNTIGLADAFGITIDELVGRKVETK